MNLAVGPDTEARLHLHLRHIYEAVGDRVPYPSTRSAFLQAKLIITAVTAAGQAQSTSKNESAGCKKESGHASVTAAAGDDAPMPLFPSEQVGMANLLVSSCARVSMGRSCIESKER